MFIHLCFFHWQVEKQPRPPHAERILFWLCRRESCESKAVWNRCPVHVRNRPQIPRLKGASTVSDTPEAPWWGVRKSLPNPEALVGSV